MSGMAQNFKPDFFNIDPLFNKEIPLLFLTGQQPKFTIKPIYSISTVMQTNQKPVFCKMEDKLNKRFNVWILLRAGSDEEYRKLINVSDK